jgi:ubiquinol-cytochrome c reductase cytochrome c subunit
MKHLTSIVLLAAFLHAPFAIAADPTAPPGSIERGKELYMKNTCYSCHGMVGQGGERKAGPRLAPDPFPYVAFAMQLRQPRGTMPRYPVQFVSDQDLADIYAYVASIPAGPKANDIPLLKNFETKS